MDQIERILYEKWASMGYDEGDLLPFPTEKIIAIQTNFQNTWYKWNRLWKSQCFTGLLGSLRDST